jgi:endonuclease III
VDAAVVVNVATNRPIVTFVVTHFQRITSVVNVVVEVPVSLA